MREFKGTPGPWESEYDNECFFTGSDDGGEYYCEFFTITNKAGADIGRVESEFDANLIAAAPDLLEALHDILWEIRVNGAVSDENKKDARAAIEKALGEKP